MSVFETTLLLLITPFSAFVIAALVLRDARRITERAHARAKAQSKSR